MRVFMITGLLMLVVLIAGCTGVQKEVIVQEPDIDSSQQDAMLPKNTDIMTDGGTASVDNPQNEPGDKNKANDNQPPVFLGEGGKDEGDGSSGTDPEVPVSSVTSEELAMHSSEDDCWVGFEGEVYDVTEFLPKHPGSAEAIIPFCGTSEEFENAFIGQHARYQVEKLLEEGVYMGELA